LRRRLSAEIKPKPKEGRVVEHCESSCESLSVCLVKESSWFYDRRASVRDGWCPGFFWTPESIECKAGASHVRRGWALRGPTHWFRDLNIPSHILKSGWACSQSHRLGKRCGRMLSFGGNCRVAGCRWDALLQTV
jgi:hypothetical protein